ncbi:hypothetical protein HHUSO_G7811, partial [Huso huso]
LKIKMSSLIAHYFDQGHSYDAILAFLSELHGIHLSMRTLKYKLKKQGLSRRLNYASQRDTIAAIRNELRGPGVLSGYRTMWQVLKQKYRLNVKRETVMRVLYKNSITVLPQLNPRGHQSRTVRRFVRRVYHSLGPNYIWHVDGYDKLKPFGFAISGCIDGFSRRLMWLTSGPTNNNPAVIANNYVNCVVSNKIIPMRLRTDCRTENGTMAAIQAMLRRHHNDYHAGNRSHLYGSSMSNQRIESWWSIFRKGRAQFWMDLFGDIRDFGLFNGSHEHQCLLRYCFMNILQTDLDECTSLWNLHRIRPSRMSLCPGGIPNEMYRLPQR